MTSKWSSKSFIVLASYVSIITGVLLLASVAHADGPIGTPIPAHAFNPPALPQSNCASTNVAYSGDSEDGISLATWVEPRVGTQRGTMLRAALIGSDGELASQPIDVSVEDPFSRSYAECFLPEVTAGPNGEFLVLWGAFDFTPGPTYSDEWIVGQIIGPDGARIGSNFRVSTITYADVYGVQAAWSDTADRYLVSNNARFLGGYFKQVGTFIDSRGAPIGSDFVLLGLPDGEIHWTDVAYNGDKWLAVGAHCSVRGEYDCQSIDGVTVAADASVSSQFEVVPNQGDGYIWGNSLAYNDYSSAFLSAWTFCSNTSPYPCYRYGRKLSSAGAPTGDPFTIENTNDGWPAALAAGGQHGFLVSWSPYASPPTALAQQLDAAASPVGTFEAASLSASSFGPQPTFVKNTGCYLLAWVGNGNPDNTYSPPQAGANLWTRRWDPDGNGPCDVPPPPPPPPSDYTLAVSKAGDGSGSISSNPAGIDCGSTCSHAFSAGASVELTATADSGSSFVGWSGDCSGASCTVTMSEARSVTAEFEADPPPPPPPGPGKPTLVSVGTAGSQRLKVRVGCGGTTACSIRLAGLRQLKPKTGRPDANLVPQTVAPTAVTRVQIRAGDTKVVSLRYTSYLRKTIKRALTRTFNPIPPKLIIHARQAGGGKRSIMVYVGN